MTMAAGERIAGNGAENSQSQNHNLQSLHVQSSTDVKQTGSKTNPPAKRAKRANQWPSRLSSIAFLFSQLSPCENR
jgi:hypothetical protein